MTSAMNFSKDCVGAWEAMPWALQGRLTPQQHEWLNGHLAHCASCRAEFAQQQRLLHAMSLPPETPLDPETGLQRLLARLDASDEGESSRLRPGHRLGWALVAVLLLQAIGLGVLSVKLWSTDQDAPYQTLSQATPAVLPGAIRVVPEASMTMADWDTLLRTLGLQVAAGPNSAGAYTVVPLTPAPTDRQAVLQRLRASRHIRLAEPVDTGP